MSTGYAVLILVCGLVAFFGGTNIASLDKNKGKFGEKFGLFVMIVGLLAFFAGIALVVMSM